MPQGFFGEQTARSRVKTEIVTKYFRAWAKIIAPHAAKRPGRMAYIDLFAGPGQYDDGSESTPLLVARHAVSDPALCRMLRMVFNDGSRAHCRALTQALAGIPDLSALAHQPVVWNNTVDTALAASLEQLKLEPSLLFADPWGYKGLSLALLKAVVADNWGCDAIFFFNYNRVRPALANDGVRQRMDDLFGPERVAAIREVIAGMPPRQSESHVMAHITEALRDAGCHYTLPFRFRAAGTNRTHHHLVFTSKSPLGYSVMKEIMAHASSEHPQGVPSFEFSELPRMLDSRRPLDDLRARLAGDYAGQTLTVKELFEKDNVGTPYIMANYRAIIYLTHQAVSAMM